MKRVEILDKEGGVGLSRGSHRGKDGRSARLADMSRPNPVHSMIVHYVSIRL